MHTARLNISKSFYLSLLCALFWLPHSNVVGQQPAIWESSYGTDLNLSDDSTANVSFGSFAFPYAGTVYTGTDILDVSSNGFVSLGGSNGDDCCSADIQSYLNDAFPRLSPLWVDLDPANASSDGVFVNTFNDDGDAADDRIAITWDAQHWSTNMDVLFQLQLFESGAIVFGYNGISPTPRDTLIGIGTGGGVTDPGTSNLSGSPFLGFGNNIYDFIPASTPDPELELDYTNIIFTPIPGVGGFVVSQIPPVPEPSSFGVLAFACLASFSRRRRR